MPRARIRVAVAVLSLVFVGCSSGDGGLAGDAGTDSTIPQDTQADSDTPTTPSLVDETEATTSEPVDGADWGTDVSGDQLCGLVDPTEVESVVGRPLAEDPAPLENPQVSTVCFYNFDPDSAISQDSLSVTVWPASAFDGLSPLEAYQARFDVNTRLGSATPTPLEGIGEEAHLMTGENTAWVQVLTDERVFEVQSATVTPEQLATLAGLFAPGL